jgi:hypothetical protein
VEQIIAMRQELEAIHAALAPAEKSGESEAA